MKNNDLSVTSNPLLSAAHSFKKILSNLMNMEAVEITFNFHGIYSLKEKY